MNARLKFRNFRWKTAKCKYAAESQHVIGVLIGRADAFHSNRNPHERIYMKSWGNFEQHTAHFEALIKLILAHNMQVILIGGKQELDVHNALSPEVLSKCIDYVGKTSVAESIALASLCDVVVGIDTGMQHISDAVGVKTVSIFGPTNPKQCGAYSSKAVYVQINEPCRPCFTLQKYLIPGNFNCPHRRCINKITPEYVFELIIRQLKS